MGKELGRIGGALLSENLLRVSRSGATTVYNNLAFDSNLLYLNVETRRIGINTTGPTRDLLIPSNVGTTNLVVDTLSQLANFTVSTDVIQDVLGTITISPAQSSPLITAPAVGTSSLTFRDSVLSNNAVDGNIVFTPSGTGVSNVRNDTLVDGILHATGNITWDGDIQLGNEATDSINFSSHINSNILPDVTNTYSLGSALQRWSNVYSKNLDIISLTADLVSATTITVGDIKFEGNKITNTNTSTDITLTASGDGKVYFDGIEYVTGNEIPVPGEFLLNSTAGGYIKFDGTTGLVIPSGETVGPDGAVTGMMRFNTDLQYVRIFNGTNWQPVGGTSSTLSQEEVTDVMWVWDIILG